MNAPQSTGQMLVDQGPRYDKKKKPRLQNQVIGKGQIIRPDKRHKPKYL
jgi:hypothetical protein